MVKEITLQIREEKKNKPVSCITQYISSERFIVDSFAMAGFFAGRCARALSFDS